MNKKVVVGIVVAVIVLGLGGWILSRSAKTSVKVESPDGQGTLTVQTADTQMSIADIMGKGGNVRCTYEVTSAESGTMSTVVYISGGKMRAESLGTDSEGVKTQSTVISDGQFTYVWSDKEETGMKIPAQQASGNTSSAWQGQAQYADPQQKADYKCESWNVDGTVFTPPSNITFTDFSALQKTQCAVCDSLSGEQKTTCLKSLNCN